MTHENPSMSNRAEPADRTAVSFVIRARNAESDLRVLLPILRGQDYPEGCVEIVVVDNESSDRTVDVARAAGAIVVSISDAEWSWGRALNRGIEASRGDIVVALSADAHPVDRGWISAMVPHFSNPRVAVVYGRQVPREDAPLDEWARVVRTFPSTDLDWTQAPDGGGRPEGLVASNSCAAMRRSVWRRIPIPENVAAEEWPWMRQALHEGFIGCYRAHPAVHHSHREPIGRAAVRDYDLLLRGAEVRRSGFGVSTALRAGVSVAKRRLLSALVPGSGVRRRIAGLVALPRDCAVFVWIGLHIARGMSIEDARRRWW